MASHIILGIFTVGTLLLLWGCVVSEIDEQRRRRNRFYEGEQWQRARKATGSKR